MFMSALMSTGCSAGGAVYLFFMSRQLATAVAGVTALLWIVALRYGNFSRKAQRTYQDALAETNQVRVRLHSRRCMFLASRLGVKSLLFTVRKQHLEFAGRLQQFMPASTPSCIMYVTVVTDSLQAWHIYIASSGLLVC